MGAEESGMTCGIVRMGVVGAEWEGEGADTGGVVADAVVDWEGEAGTAAPSMQTEAIAYGEGTQRNHNHMALPKAGWYGWWFKIDEIVIQIIPTIPAPLSRRGWSSSHTNIFPDAPPSESEKRT